MLSEFYLIEREVWSIARSTDWWQSVSSGDSWWWDNLRMSRETFQFLCRELHPHISKQVTRMRDSVNTERRVAITLWKLATNIEYRSCLGWVAQ